MSNRAIRRARERELGSSFALHESSDDELPATKQSMFALLGEAETEDQDNEEDEEEGVEADVSDKVKEVATSGGKKKKKKKKKKKGKAAEGDAVEEASEKLGESGLVAASVGAGWDEVLRISAKNLDALNEVRLLFGSAALQADDEGTGGPRRRGERATARGGRGVRAPMSARRNLFVRGNDLWPKGGSGGLGMEVVHQDYATGTTEFRFVHSPSYQDLQKQFVVVVESLGTFESPPILYFQSPADMWNRR